MTSRREVYQLASENNVSQEDAEDFIKKFGLWDAFVYFKNLSVAIPALAKLKESTKGLSTDVEAGKTSYVRANGVKRSRKSGIKNFRPTENLALGGDEEA